MLGTHVSIMTIHACFNLFPDTWLPVYAKATFIYYLFIAFAACLKVGLSLLILAVVCADNMLCCDCSAINECHFKKAILGFVSLKYDDRKLHLEDER